MLVFVDLALGRMEMGGSPLCQVFQQAGTHAPDVRHRGYQGPSQRVQET